MFHSKKGAAIVVARGAGTSAEKAKDKGAKGGYAGPQHGLS